MQELSFTVTACWLFEGILEFASPIIVIFLVENAASALSHFSQLPYLGRLLSNNYQVYK